eukprot:3594161-Amphidinium_carterae.2
MNQFDQNEGNPSHHKSEPRFDKNGCAPNSLCMTLINVRVCRAVKQTGRNGRRAEQHMQWLVWWWGAPC